VEEAQEELIRIEMTHSLSLFSLHKQVAIIITRRKEEDDTVRVL
jgi:hypothetical protein